MPDSAANAASSGRLGRFLGWWLDGLGDVFMGRCRSAVQWSRLLIRSADGLRVHVRKLGKIRVLREIPDSDLQDTARGKRRAKRLRTGQRGMTILRLADDQVLHHSLEIPKVADDVVDPIVRNQLERRVPWPAEELIFGYRLAGADTESDMIRVDCVATSKARIDTALQAAVRLGLEPDIIDAAPDAQTPLGVRLNWTNHDRRRADRLAVGRGMLLVTLVAMVVMAGGLWRMLALKSELDAVNASVGDLRAQVAETRRFELQTEAIVAERRRLHRQRAAEPALVVALEALSRSLPDHAYLERLDIRNAEAEIHGQASDAAALIQRLESSSHFSDARFAAPTTRERGKGDRFAISLRLRPVNTLGKAE